MAVGDADGSRVGSKLGAAHSPQLARQWSLARGPVSTPSTFPSSPRAQRFLSFSASSLSATHKHERSVLPFRIHVVLSSQIVGCDVGCAVSAVGSAVGLAVGSAVGLAVGSTVG